MPSSQTIFTFLLFLCLSEAHATAPLVPIDALKPKPEHHKATQLITHVLENYHYKNTPLDDELSKAVLKRYIAALDPARSYFLRSDIDEFSRHAEQIDDYLRRSNLDPMFSFFARFRKRLKQRVDYALQLLDSEFDFNFPETIDFDREAAPWANNQIELEEIWRKRVKNDILSLRLGGKNAEDLSATLRERYSGLFRRTAQLNSEDIFEIFINAYTTAIDPHTAYFSPRTSENFKIRMSLSLEGIGAVLQSENEFTLVREIVTGGPADLSDKLHADDRIVGIGQTEQGPIVDVIGWRLDDVVALIRGPKHSVVRLEILPKGVGPGGPANTIAITRNTIKLEKQAAQGSILELSEISDNVKIGIIDVPMFYMDFEARSSGARDYRSTTRDVRTLIEDLKLEDVSGLVLDLRGNGGGSLDEATELTGLFIDTGPIVQVRDARGRIQIERDIDKGAAYDGPIIVLVDRNSASASEIFAGAIQDYRRGIVVGEITFGKGTVQNLVDLNRFDQGMDGKLGQLKTTIAQFFRVQGGSTQHRGVQPDIILPTLTNLEDHGERSLDNALPWDSIEPVRFKPINHPISEIDVIRSRHEDRVLNDPVFQAILSAERTLKETRDRKTLSLVEKERREEYRKVRTAQRVGENQIRVARGLEPLSIDSANDQNLETASETDIKDEDFDVVLTEAGQMLYDWLFQRLPPKRLVERTRDTDESQQKDDGLSDPPRSLNTHIH